MDTIAIVGASLAGLSAARALRTAGFEGRLIVLGDEKHAPYDRPPLSKDFLAGRQEVADLALSIPADADLTLEWRLGQCATALRPQPAPGSGYLIDVAGGEPVTCDGVVIATGARARSLPTAAGVGPLRGVHTLRTLDDAQALRAALVPGARLVVVGGGFIGAEIASTALALEAKVTLVEVAATALAGPLGEELGSVLAALHVARGVEVLTGIRVEALIPASDGSAAVSGVRLADGRELPADVVLVGIGSIPNTEWLAGSGVLGAGPDGDLAAGVAITDGGATNLPGVVATGDCAATHSRFAERVVRYEHWTNALQHPSLAVATLLGQPAPRQSATAGVPYFWSDQYGLRLQFAGHCHPGDVVEIVEGEVTDLSFVAVYRRAGRPVAVLGIGQPKVFGRWRKQLATDFLAPSVQ